MNIVAYKNDVLNPILINAFQPAIWMPMTGTFEMEKSSEIVWGKLADKFGMKFQNCS